MATENRPSLAPDNAEVELKRAYNLAIETGVTHFWERHAIPGVHADEVFTLYKRAMSAYQEGSAQSRLIAERWARAAKHLAQACWHEAKVDYLEPRATELPFLPDGRVEYRLHAETRETARSLLDSAEERMPHSKTNLPYMVELEHYLQRGRKHLEKLDSNPGENELLHAERIKAAHEYGRTLECAILAVEAMEPPKAEAA